MYCPKDNQFCIKFHEQNFSPNLIFALPHLFHPPIARHWRLPICSRPLPGLGWNIHSKMQNWWRTLQWKYVPKEHLHLLFCQIVWMFNRLERWCQRKNLRSQSSRSIQLSGCSNRRIKQLTILRPLRLRWKLLFPWQLDHLLSKVQLRGNGPNEKTRFRESAQINRTNSMIFY